MKRVVIAIAGFAFSVALSAMPLTTSSATAQQPDLSRWEYRVLTKEQIIDLGKKDLVSGLNKLGDEGWELAAVDSQYIFKRPKDRQSKKTPAVLQEQFALAEADVAAWKDRVAWAERMVKKGYLSNTQLEADRAHLQRATLVLELARQALQKQTNDPKGPAEKERQPEK